MDAQGSGAPVYPLPPGKMEDLALLTAQQLKLVVVLQVASTRAEH